MGDSNLAGRTILIVEPQIAQFVYNLQGALEQMGAETLIAREPADAFERMRSFSFSACVINYDHASDALHAFIGDLGRVPVLLYGGAGASVASTRVVRHLAFTHATVGSIVSDLCRLLSRPKTK
jgi:hypothetical protein